MGDAPNARISKPPKKFFKRASNFAERMIPYSDWPGSIQQEQQRSAHISSPKNDHRPDRPVVPWPKNPVLVDVLSDWLGGLDSNQDSQSQSLESYQLDDLPAGTNRNESRHVRLSRQPR